LKSSSTTDESKETFTFSEIKTFVLELIEIITTSFTSSSVQAKGISLLKMLNSNVKDATGKTDELTTFSTKMTTLKEKVTSSLTKVQETAKTMSGEEFSSSSIHLVTGDGSGFTGSDGTEIFVQKSESILSSNLLILAQNADAVEKVISIIALQLDKEDQNEGEEEESSSEKEEKLMDFGKYFTIIKKFSVLIKEIKDETLYSTKFQSLALSVVQSFSQGVMQGSSIQYEQLSKQMEIFQTFSSKLNVEINRVLIDYRAVTGLIEYTISNVVVETISNDGTGIFGKTGTSVAISENMKTITENVFNIKKASNSVGVLIKILADDTVGSSENAISSAKYIKMWERLIKIISLNVYDRRIQSKTFALYEAKMKTTVKALTDAEKTKVQAFVKIVEKAKKIIETSETEMLTTYKKVVGKEFSAEDEKSIATITETGDLSETTISSKFSIIDIDKQFHKSKKIEGIVLGMQSSIFRIINQISKSSFSSSGATIEFAEVKQKIKQSITLLDQNLMSDTLEKYGQDLEFFTTAKVVGFKSKDISYLFKQYKKLTGYIIILAKQTSVFSQNMGAARIKKAIVSIMEVEDGIPKLKEALKNVKTPDQSVGFTYKCSALVGFFKSFTNQLISNNYLHCTAATLIEVLSTAKPETDCTDNELTAFDQLSDYVDDYDNQIPKLKSQLMDIYFEVTEEMFDSSSVTLVNVFKEDGTFDEGKGSDC